MFLDIIVAPKEGGLEPCLCNLDETFQCDKAITPVPTSRSQFWHASSSAVGKWAAGLACLACLATGSFLAESDIWAWLLGLLAYR